MINNAGIVRDAPFEDMTADRLDPLLDVHLKGAFHLTRPVWKVMREQRYGRVLNTCSAAGILGAERMSNYGLAKTGLIGFTRVLAAEGADRNIKVNAIAPIGYTRMLAHSLDTEGRQDDAADQALLDELVGQYLQKLDPALVAPVAAFLTHRDCPVSGRSTRSALDTSHDSSSAGQGGTTARRCRSKRCGIISARSATRTAIPSPGGPPTR